MLLREDGSRIHTIRVFADQTSRSDEVPRGYMHPWKQVGTVSDNMLQKEISQKVYVVLVLFFMLNFCLSEFLGVDLPFYLLYLPRIYPGLEDANILRTIA